jgi:hypothetical protein
MRPLAWQGVLALLALCGVALAWRQRIAGDWLLWLAFKLLVTVAFYGYARQGVTAQLALYVLVALSLDALIALIPAHQQRWLVRPLWIIGLLMSADVALEGLDRRSFDVRAVGGARVVAAQQWGSGGFECQGAIELSPAPDGKMGER